MSIALPAVLMLAGFLFSLGPRRRLGVLLAVLACVTFYVFGTGAWPAFILRGLQQSPHVDSPQWKEKNAIVLLGAGTIKWPSNDAVSTPSWAYSRIFEAARLYLNCKNSSPEVACTIIASGGDPSGNGVSEAEDMAQDLKAIGIAADDIKSETESRNTFQNAKNTAKLLSAGAFDQIYLVTSGFHMRRALLFYSYFDVPAHAAPADHLLAMNSWLPVSFNFIFTDLALHEYGGIAQFYFYNFMGWNSKP